MRNLSKVCTMFTVAAVVALLTIVSPAYAADGTNWENGVITVEGQGVAPANAHSAAQARMLARRTAVVDAYRQLAELVKGVNVDSETTVENAMVSNDTIKTRVSALVQGAKIVSEQAHSDGGYSVTMQISVFGVSDSIARAVLPENTTKEAFPVLETYPAAEGTTTPPISNPPALSSAAPAPAGTAIGNYTGLIVDCTGFGLKPVMSPVIKNENGTPIYGYKNLDCDKVIANGMAGYVKNISNATRAGSNPLVVKAIRLDNHNGNPVISLADANRVLIENGATGFLDDTNVVFLR